jgi:arylsulfatase B
MGYVDVLPTLARLADVPAADRRAELDGIDVLPALKGEGALPDRTFYLGRQAVVTRRWKLREEELFDLSEDPGETADVAAAHPDVAERLRRDLAGFEALQSPRRVPPYNEGREGFVAPKRWQIP